MYAVDHTRGAATFSWWRDVWQLRRGRPVALAAVERCGEGEFVRVVARVKADAQIEGALHGTRGVFRRVVFSAHGMVWVHERGVDFSLVDGDERVLVCVGGGRMIAPREELIEYPAHRLDGFGVPALRGRRSVLAREHVITDGALVEVVGHKTMMADPAGDPSGYRDLRQLAALRASRSQELLVVMR